MVEHLSPRDARDPDKWDGPEHPMRIVTRETAFEAASWTDERRRKVQGVFDGLADQWHTRHGESRLLPLRDALERGEVTAGICLEIGCGTGPATEALAGHFATSIAIDLSWEMLSRAAGAPAGRVRADGAALPFTDASADTIVLMNMLLFPAEMERVLRPGGTIVWVNSRGAGTPIHLSAEDLVAALPGAWQAKSALAGPGLWAVARRA
ncbi:MAG: class I SAM-dependent methyltransferase [Deltaproteobacteria bacterium]